MVQLAIFIIFVLSAAGEVSIVVIGLRGEALRHPPQLVLQHKRMQELARAELSNSAWLAAQDCRA